MTRFTTLLWTTGSDAPPRRVWAERVRVALHALQEHAGIERFWTVEREPHEVSLETPALERLIAAGQSTDDAGRPWPEMGSTFEVLCTGPGDDPARPRFRAGFTVDSTAREPLKNLLSVRFDPQTGASAARAVLEACVPAWSPYWGCVQSSANVDEREEELEEMSSPEDEGLLLPISSLLHWITYFGPERAAELDVTSVEDRSDVTVHPLHEGVEVVLGERWESDEVLRARQREIEPLVLGSRIET